MEKRVLLAIFLAFLVLYVWQALFGPAPQPPGQPPPGGATAPITASPPASQPEGPSAPTAPSAPGAPTLTAAPVVGEATERDVRVETRDVIAVFTNRGARLKSFRLKNYNDRASQAVELVATELSGSHPLPFSVYFPDAVLTRTINSALFTVAGTPSSQGPITSPARLTFEYRDSAGVHAVKEFQLEPSSYVVSVVASISQGDRRLTPAIDWGPGLGDTGTSPLPAVPTRGLFAIASEVSRVTPEDVAETPRYEGNFQYAGVDDHYFMSTALSPSHSSVVYEPVTIPPPAGSQTPGRQLMAYRLETQRPLERPIRFYLGPKDFDVLAAVDRELVRAIDFGMFAVIVVPLLRTLNWIYGFVGNYGWAIVILSIIINVVIFPLRHKQVTSMRKMQEIQPEIKAIQERYAKYKTTDPAKQKMNQELMALYRERGVNPAAGCVPVLIPLPVFFAFYALLGTAIELRGAPFVGWIPDLSQPDPYYVTPIIMVITQVLQTWMMPSAGADPMQQRMMMIMPVVLGFIFLSMPSGVVIYWVVNNIWGIGQQWVTNRLIGPPTVRNLRPAAERRVKKVGSGKTDGAREG